MFRRIVSLAPSATELVLALGAGDRLLAVTRWCKDVCDTGGRPELRDCWTVEPDEVMRHRPDLVIGSVPYSVEVTGKLIASGARFVAMNPVRLADVFLEIEMLGRLLGETECAYSLVAGLRARLEEIRKVAQTSVCAAQAQACATGRPRVYSEAWPNPLISSPRWVEDLVEIAGGEFVPLPGGRKVSSDEVIAARPEVVVLAWTATGDRAEPAKVLERPGWSGLPAVSDARTHVVRDQWLNTPSLILRRGAEALAALLHPEACWALAVETEVEDAVARAEGPTALEAVVAVLKERVPHYHWVGVYVVEGNELVLGPFRGKPTEHTRIPLDRGICGAAAREGRTVVVPDVSSDPRYLACSLETRSEIVVPIFANGRAVAEIDIDSDCPNAFGDADRRLLEHAAEMLAARFHPTAPKSGAAGTPVKT